MGTLTTNYEFQLPTIGGDDDVWGNDFSASDDPMTDPSPGLNGNWEKADQVIADLEARIAALEGGTPGPYYERGDGYTIAGTTLECWGNVSVTSGATVITFPKQFTARPKLFLLPVGNETPPNITLYSAMGVRQDTAADLYQALVRIQEADQAGYILSMTASWRAIGTWDGN